MTTHQTRAYITRISVSGDTDLPQIGRKPEISEPFDGLFRWEPQRTWCVRVLCVSGIRFGDGRVDFERGVAHTQGSTSRENYTIAPRVEWVVRYAILFIGFYAAFITRNTGDWSVDAISPRAQTTCCVVWKDSFRWIPMGFYSKRVRHEGTQIRYKWERVFCLGLD